MPRGNLRNLPLPFLGHPDFSAYLCPQITPEWLDIDENWARREVPPVRELFTFGRICNPLNPKILRIENVERLASLS